MQRLFSMFPRGAPGIGLLMLRVAVVAAIWQQTPNPLDYDLPESAWLPIRAVLSVTLATGALTPAAAVTVVLLSMDWPSFNAVHGFAAGALCLLGPGAYSIDGFMFGRRVVVMTAGRESSNVVPTEKE